MEVHKDDVAATGLGEYWESIIATLYYAPEDTSPTGFGKNGLILATYKVRKLSIGDGSSFTFQLVT